MEMPARKMLNRTYWVAFIVAVRLVAILLVAASVGLLVGAFSGSGGDKPLLVILAILLGTPAALMLRAKAFRPDIDGYGAALGGQATENRGWWTGSVKRASGSNAA